MGQFILVARLLVAVPAAMLFLLCILGNWSLLIGMAIHALRGRKRRSCSLVLPFLGPAFGSVFFLAIPLRGFARWWWLATLIEPTWMLGAWILLTLPFVDRGGTDEISSRK